MTSLQKHLKIIFIIIIFFFKFTTTK